MSTDINASCNQVIGNTDSNFPHFYAAWHIGVYNVIMGVTSYISIDYTVIYLHIFKTKVRGLLTFEYFKY